MKRVFALVLCLCLVLACAPAAFAAETGNVTMGGNTYNTVEEALAAGSGTITLNDDVTAGQIIIPQGTTLDLNGKTLTADMIIVFNGAIVGNGGKIVVAKDMMKVIGDNNGQVPVWNAAESCYTFATVNYQQMMQVPEDLSWAKYIFIPNFDLNTIAMMADGGADNGVSIKVLLTWNNGLSQQIYTFSEEMVAQVYSSANANGVCAQVFQLTITGIEGITDMTACAVVESTAGGKAVNAESKVALPEPEPEPDPEPEEPVSVTETFTMSDYKTDELGGTTCFRNLGDKAVFTISSGWFTSEARIYKNANGVIASTTGMSSVTLNIGYKDSTFNVYTSEDGETWTEYQMGVAYTSAYSDITFDFATPVNYIKIDAPNAQARIKVITITFSGAAAEEPTPDPEPEPDPEPDVPTPDPEPDVPTPEPDFNLTIEEAIALGKTYEKNSYTTDKYYVTGEVVSVDNTTYGNMYIKDEAGNKLLIYGTYSADGSTRYDAMTVKPVAGDTVTLYGVIGMYNEAQMKNANMTAHTPGEGTTEPEEPENNDPAADSVLTIAEAIALGKTKEHNAYTSGKYYVTGQITAVNSTTYGNMWIQDEAGNTLTLYGTYDATGANRYDAMTVKPVVGDTITVYGIIGQYSNEAQMKNGWITEHIPGEGEPEPEEPVEGVGVKIDFNNAANRKSQDNNSQVWQENGITVTNEKAASTTNVAAYAPIRLYQGSSLKIEYAGMTKIVFTCDTYKNTYASALQASIGSQGTVTVSGTTVTVVLSAATNEFVISKLTAQVRLDDLTVYTN